MFESSKVYYNVILVTKVYLYLLVFTRHDTYININSIKIMNNNTEIRRFDIHIDSMKYKMNNR